MNEAMMVPIALILIVVIYALTMKQQKPDPKDLLFRKLVKHGCEDCGGDFQVVHAELTKGSELRVECDCCSKPYMIDHTMQWAWRL